MKKVETSRKTEKNPKHRLKREGVRILNQEKKVISRGKGMCNLMNHRGICLKTIKAPGI